MREGGTQVGASPKWPEGRQGEGKLAADGRFVGTAGEHYAACRVQVTDQKEDSKPGKSESQGEERKKRQSSKEEMNDQEAAQ